MSEEINITIPEGLTDCDPDTYRNFTTEAVDYYLHVFSLAAKTGDTPGIHCTRCAELVAMLDRLKDLQP